MKNKKLITILDLAKYLSISEEYVRRLIAQNDIPHIKIFKKIFFQKEDIDSWLSNEKTIRSDKSKISKKASQ